jgi:hypothetical protein
MGQHHSRQQSTTKQYLMCQLLAGSSDRIPSPHVNTSRKTTTTVAGGNIRHIQQAHHITETNKVVTFIDAANCQWRHSQDEVTHLTSAACYDDNNYHA